jgi:hypothetical protein
MNPNLYWPGGMWGRQSYWTNPPNPFLVGSKKAWVPGWGANPAVAGPARVGVGEFKWAPQTSILKATRMPQAEAPPEPEKPGTKIPWWYYVTGVAVVAAGGALAYNMGWIGGK